jgi:hypothetical protein
MPFCLLSIVVERIPQPLPESLLFRWWESTEIAAPGAAGRAPFARHARVVSGARRTPHGEGGADVVAPSREAGGRLEQRAACVASHVLFASGNARGPGDSRARRPLGSHDDAAVHASQSRDARARDSVARGSRVRAKKFGDVGETRRGIVRSRTSTGKRS